MKEGYTTKQLCEIVEILNKYGDAEKGYGDSFNSFQNETDYITTMSAQNPPMCGKREYKFIVVSKN